MLHILGQGAHLALGSTHVRSRFSRSTVTFGGWGGGLSPSSWEPTTFKEEDGAGPKSAGHIDRK